MILGRELPVIQEPDRLRPERSEVRQLLSDNRKALAQLGWQPKISLGDGLMQTVDWIRSNIQLYRPDQYQR
jgi:nucleoside-diphosphate-sugar epimerase